MKDWAAEMQAQEALEFEEAYEETFRTIRSNLDSDDQDTNTQLY